MAGGIYAALSGLQTQTARLDRVAMDIANFGTTGYKAERNMNVAAERSPFSTVLDSAVDVMLAPPSSDFRTGESLPTGRDLDLAIEGRGFFSIQTPAGVRYTRNGHFTRSLDGNLASQDGSPVLGENGPIKLPSGPVVMDPDGSLSVAGVNVGRPKIVDFEVPSRLIREDGVRFRAAEGMTAIPAANAQVRPGLLEQSNVSLPEHMAQLTQLSRGFEALQRGLSVLMNEIDGRAIVELGRR